MSYFSQAMLTRLEVNNFKNLVAIDVRFGAFTCIAGANGVGKSNLFDAIRFLSLLTDWPILDAVMSMRDEGNRSSDLRTLFHKAGDRYADTMTFAVEMITPPEGVDDLGQPAKASLTFVRYELHIRYRDADAHNPAGSLEITHESLRPLGMAEARKTLGFPHSPAFRTSALVSYRKRKGTAFISTIQSEEGKCVIQLHQDGGSSGQPQKRLATALPRTVLSVTNATEHPTALMAKREMQSWQMLQMEPTALRAPDELSLSASSHIAANGAHLPATLFRLASLEMLRQGPPTPHQLPLEDQALAGVFSRVARRLNELIEDVRDISVDRDDKRQLLVLKVRLKDGTELPARSLSDGTLRFLALAVLEQDSQAQGLLCLEEPENGIHPARIAAMLRLLNDIACDATTAIGPDNPLRQVIINTHAPAVVQEVPDDSLVLADTVATRRAATPTQPASSYRTLSLSCLSATWRSDEARREATPGEEPMPTMARGKLVRYLDPVAEEPVALEDAPPRQTTRVVDRPDIQALKVRQTTLAL